VSSFIVLACLNVSLVWLEVSQRIQRLEFSDKSSVFYQRVVYAFQIFIVVISLISIATGAYFIAFLIFIPYLVGLAGTFWVGRRRFTKVLDELSGESKNENSMSGLNEIAARVKFTSLGVIIGLVITFILGFIYSLLSHIDWRIYAPRDAMVHVGRC